MIRKPVVAGLFYDDEYDSLKKTIENCFYNKLGPQKIPKLGVNNKKIYGAVVPHAGYVYSGPIAAHAYYEIVESGFPETFIILCPNHTGFGEEISVYAEGSWETPLGIVDIDEKFANNLISSSDIVSSDTSAHMKEHSCEVHLPFLQYFSNDFKIVPIVMKTQNMEFSQNLGQIIAKTAKNLEESICIIGSTDLTHYQPEKIAQEQDKLILDAIANMDEFALMNYIKELNISMCGYGPTISTMVSTRILGAKKAKILKYATSGNISGDFSSVVGYGSAIFE